MISDSAKTVQVVLILGAFLDLRARGPSSDRGSSMVMAAAPRKRPVPAAHLSFMEKSRTLPSGPTLIALVSWPPMSMTVRVLGKRYLAPLAWQLISVTWALPKLIL